MIRGKQRGDCASNRSLRRHPPSDLQLVMAEPLAYFLTWSCHGNWLAGDERGSVDRKHNQYGMPFIEPNSDRKHDYASAMKSLAVTLTTSARQVVEKAIRDHCAIRNWELPAVNVRTTHVHCVVGYHGTRPEIVMGQLKSWATRRLRDANLHGPGPCWTREGSTRYLFSDRDVADAVTYVMECQDNTDAE